MTTAPTTGSRRFAPRTGEPNSIRQLVFWQNVVSLHQVGLLEAAAKRLPGRVSLIVDQAFNQKRIDQGWSVETPSGVDLIVSPDNHEIATICQNYSTADCHHVFSGIDAYRGVYHGLKTASQTEARLNVYAERPDARTLVRRMHSQIRGRVNARRWRNRIHRVLAVGDLANQYYRQIGFAREQVRTFGYFHDCAASSPQKTVSKCFQIACVARQVPLKRIDLLIHSLRHLSEFDWQASIVGDGPLLGQNKKLAASLGLSDRVHWTGTLSHNDVQSIVQGSDLLVLPSDYDGWGAVINEAFSVGTPVVVSGACGAATTVCKPIHGAVFRSGCEQSLTDSLLRQIRQGPPTKKHRECLQNWYRQALAPAAGADYLIEILSGNSTEPPWISSSSSLDTQSPPDGIGDGS
ncbi:glycosyltransferase [Roseiconus nitratireducens]|uniref:Glycosyltransferase n=1 Tax=Roseiconus nitratireducens TaxID=2605748 RepID=A0A5M6CWX7_9BACT|nr:glycosyltransferase [Roseiconus nitratireducens]KAA5538900.1 glycosyltransferase [Roseiconus nitratireducens]